MSGTRREIRRELTAADKARLVEQFKGLVWQFAHKLQARVLGQRFGTAEDLANEGFIYLFEAAESFDEGRGTKFITYAYGYVWGKMRAAIQRDNGLIRVPCQLVSRRDGVDRLTGQARAAFFCAGPLHYEDGHESGLAVEEEAEDSDLPFTIELLREAVTRLPPVEWFVIDRRYGLWGEKPLTLAKVAALLGCSRERVRQHEEEALQRLHGLTHDRLAKAEVI